MVGCMWRLDMTKYGMRYSRILYNQRYAKDVVRYRGDAGVFQRQLQFALRYQGRDARTIAYRAIQCAAVCHPSAIKFAISGR